MSKHMTLMLRSLRLACNQSTETTGSLAATAKVAVELVQLLKTPAEVGAKNEEALG